MEALTRMPFTAQKKIFEKLAKYADSHRLTQKEQEQYENSLWIARDYMACREADREEAIAEGKAEGKKEAQNGIALNLLSLNVPLDVIAKSTGLSIEEIKSLK